MTIGWVYVAISDSFPGDCKIGFTLRSVPERMAELQRQYRTRHPFTAYESMLVKNPRRVEQLTHWRVAEYRNPKTELFECSPETGKAALLWAIDKVIEEHRQNPHVMQTRPKRKKTMRSSGRSEESTLMIASFVISANLVIAVLAWHPEWMPDPVRRTYERISERVVLSLD